MSETNEPSLGSRLAASNWQGVVGLAAFVTALLLYRSFENRPVLDRWSYPYAGICAGSVILLLAVGVWNVVSIRRGRETSVAARFLGLAVLFWGIGYLLSALEDRDSAARILDGNFIGSSLPFAVVAEWISLVSLVGASILWAIPRLGDKGRKILLAISALALVMLVGEGAVRLRALIAPQTQGFPTLTTQQWTRRYVSLNSEGFRDVEHERSASPGRRRILIVGDSIAFGHGIDQIEDRFGEVLASMLSQRLGERWESVSSAVPDSDTIDEIDFLERMERYQRDAVILLYVFNDIDYLVPTTARTLLTETPDSMFGRLHPIRLLFGNFYFFQELFAYRRLAGYARSNPPFVSVYADAVMLRQHMDDVARFVKIASRGGVPVVIVAWTNWIPTHGGEASPYARFTSEGLERGLPIVTLTGAFENYPVTDLRVNRLDSHPNELANRLAAEWVVGPIATRLTSEAIDERMSRRASAPRNSGALGRAARQ